nr:hypothetical protein [Tanacetum cinerariifolium]
SDEEDDNEETREEESFEPIPKTPEGSEDEGDGEEDQGLNVNEKEHVKEEEEDELYRHVNINQGRGLQATLEVKDTHVTLTLINSDGMESIFVTASSLVAPLHTSTPTMTPSTIATITTISQAPIPPTPIPSKMNEAVRVAVQIQTDWLCDSYQRENDEFLRTIDENLKRIIKEQVKGQVKEQVSKILPRIEQFVNAQLEAKVLTRSSHSSRTSYAVAADLSEMEMKKILIKKMEGNKSIQRSDKDRNLYKALVDAYEADKIILNSYGEIVILKRRRDDDDDDDDDDKDEESFVGSDRGDQTKRNLYKALVDAYEADKTILDSYGKTTILKRRREDDDDLERPSVGSDRGSKRRKEGGEPESASAPLVPATRSTSRSTTGSKSRQASASESDFAEEPVQTTSQIEEPLHLVFETGAEDKPIVQSSQHLEWFSQSKKPPTPDRDWNTTLPAAQGSTQLWITDLAKQADSCSSFNELLDTPLDFSNFIMNRLGVDTLTLELLAGPTYKLMRGSCNSLIELEYHSEEVYKATTDQLDWVNPEGQQYLHDLLHPFPLIPDNRGRHVIPFAHFINNDLEYLWGGSSSQKYTTSVTKTKAADYEHIKWIEDLESALDVYSKRRIIAVTDLKIMEWHNYKHLDWILDVYKEYRHPAVYGRSSTGSRNLPEEAQPYQARHLPIRSKVTRSVYCLFEPRGVIYQNKDKKNRLMRIDELHKFSDGTLNDVRNALDDRLKGIRMQYLPQTIQRKGDKDRAAA